MNDVQVNKVFYQRNVDLGIDCECHECISHGTCTEGYSQIKVNGRIQLIHRYLYIQATGENPEVVMHLCDNRRCINLDHLRGGTSKENVEDKVRKGRSRGINSGEMNPNSRLTEKEVRGIRKKLDLKIPINSISKEFGVSRRTVGDIRTKKTWRYVI